MKILPIMLCLQPPAPHVLHCLFNGGKNPDEADRRQARVYNTCCDFKRPTLTQKLSIDLISLYLLRVCQLYLYLVFIKQIKKSRRLSFPCWSNLYAGDLWFGSGLADQIKTNKRVIYINCILTTFHYLNQKQYTISKGKNVMLRDQIRDGLEELQRVLPGGDTFMHKGFQRVRS